MQIQPLFLMVFPPREMPHEPLVRLCKCKSSLVYGAVHGGLGHTVLSWCSPIVDHRAKRADGVHYSFPSPGHCTFLGGKLGHLWHILHRGGVFGPPDAVIPPLSGGPSAGTSKATLADGPQLSRTGSCACHSTWRKHCRPITAESSGIQS